jgi:hypothetical protein
MPALNDEVMCGRRLTPRIYEVTRPEAERGCSTSTLIQVGVGIPGPSPPGTSRRSQHSVGDVRCHARSRMSAYDAGSGELAPGVLGFSDPAPPHSVSCCHGQNILGEVLIEQPSRLPLVEPCSSPGTAKTSTGHQ